MLFLLGPVFTAVAVYLVVRPTKVDGEAPERKRRDWPVIWGLFVPGIILLWLWLQSVRVLARVFSPGGKVKMVGKAAGTLLTAARSKATQQPLLTGLTDGDPVTAAADAAPGLVRYLLPLTAAAAVYAAVDEGYLRPAADRRKRSAQAVGRVVGYAATPGYSDRFDVAVTYVSAADGRTRGALTRSLALPPAGPVPIGQPWPTPVHYDPTAPDRDRDASLRPYPVYRSDVRDALGMAVVLVVLYVWWS